MSLLPPAINTSASIINEDNDLDMHDGTSPTAISPHDPDGYYPNRSPSLPNEQQENSPNSPKQENEPQEKARKFVCQYCARRFLRAEHLRRHEITRKLPGHSIVG
jgi:hypothetical protein